MPAEPLPVDADDAFFLLSQPNTQPSSRTPTPAKKRARPGVPTRDGGWDEADRRAFEAANAQALRAACSASADTEAVLDAAQLGRWVWPDGKRRQAVVLIMTDGRGWRAVGALQWPNVYARAAGDPVVQRATYPTTAADVGRLERALPAQGAHVHMVVQVNEPGTTGDRSLYRHRLSALCSTAVTPVLRFGERDAQLLWLTAAPRSLCFALRGGDVLLFAEPVPPVATAVYTHGGGRMTGHMPAIRAAETLDVGDEPWPGTVVASKAESPLAPCDAIPSGVPDEDQVVLVVGRPGLLGGSVIYATQPGPCEVALDAADLARLAEWSKYFFYRDVDELFRAYMRTPFRPGNDPRERVNDKTIFGMALAELDGQPSGFLELGAARDALSAWARDEAVVPMSAMFSAFQMTPPLPPEKAALLPDATSLARALSATRRTPSPERLTGGAALLAIRELVNAAIDRTRQGGPGKRQRTCA